MQGQQARPIPNSYWVRPGKLLAGEYPRTPLDGTSRTKLKQLLEADVTFFLDLTEAGEYQLKPYTSLLQEEAAALGRTVEYRRRPIWDMSTPTVAGMVRILDTIDVALSAGPGGLRSLLWRHWSNRNGNRLPSGSTRAGWSGRTGGDCPAAAENPSGTATPRRKPKLSAGWCAIGRWEANRFEIFCEN